jgi:hypothetical protein
MPKPLTEECTQLFLQYREVARLVWNLGFWPDPELRAGACVLSYEDAMARLFEGMVLLRLGYGERVPAWPHGLGQPIKFAVTIKSPAQLDVNGNLPDAGYSMFGDPVVQVDPGQCELRFMSFFDWSQLAPRDYRWLRVLIERFDDRPETVGHEALIEFDKCSIWLAEEACNDV